MNDSCIDFLTSTNEIAAAAVGRRVALDKSEGHPGRFLGCATLVAIT